ncbi:MAG: phosphatidylserine decarboxylase [Bacteroidales bacterium]|nr:phosphatidylserine decarboxylase [Bacteroidales bacterium]
MAALISFAAVLGYFALLFGIRFYRIPFLRGRHLQLTENDVLSPADGNVIYIKRIESGQVPCAVKNAREATLHEVMQTEMMEGPCWMIGINMTPFDVHRNAAPLAGEIVLNHHVNGEFVSLKDENALGRNERNTIVINHDGALVGVVQTASRLVRRIDTYKKEGDTVRRGEWFGMIRFGSQVDVIIPASWQVSVELGQQIYCKETLIAKIQ